MDSLWAERGRLRRHLRELGVAERDLDDQVQEALLGAWLALRAGRFRPEGDPAAVLKCWLRGIAWRVASNYRRRAAARHEVLDPEPRAGAGDGELVLAARAELRAATAALAPGAAVLLLEAASGMTPHELAASRGWRPGRAWREVQLARDRVLAAVARAGARERFTVARAGSWSGCPAARSQGASAGPLPASRSAAR